MRGPVTASGRDLRTLAGIVSDDRGEPPAEGLAPSLLGDLLGLIRCDLVVFSGTDSSRQVDWFGQTMPTEAHHPEFDEASFWSHYWNSPCSYPEHTGDLRRHRLQQLEPGDQVGVPGCGSVSCTFVTVPFCVSCTISPCSSTHPFRAPSALT